MDGFFSKENLELWSSATLLGSMQFSIGSVEMSSKFSVRNFAKDETTLQSGILALQNYDLIGIIWTFALAGLFYAKHGIHGFIIVFIVNLAIMMWIFMSYHYAFEAAAKQNGLKYEMPSFF